MEEAEYNIRSFQKNNGVPSLNRIPYVELEEDTLMPPVEQLLLTSTNIMILGPRSCGKTTLGDHIVQFQSENIQHVPLCHVRLDNVSQIAPLIDPLNAYRDPNTGCPIRPMPTFKFDGKPKKTIFITEQQEVPPVDTKWGDAVFVSCRYEKPTIQSLILLVLGDYIGNYVINKIDWKTTIGGSHGHEDNRHDFLVLSKRFGDDVLIYSVPTYEDFSSVVTDDTETVSLSYLMRNRGRILENECVGFVESIKDEMTTAIHQRITQGYTTCNLSDLFTHDGDCNRSQVFQLRVRQLATEWLKKEGVTAVNPETMEVYWD